MQRLQPAVLKMYFFFRSKGLMIITVVYEFVIRKITKVVCGVNTINNHDYFIMQLCNAEACNFVWTL